MHKINSITIGIPAYNEESNIGFLLEDLMSQKLDNLSLNKIIVSSDGSTDNTVKIVKLFSHQKINVIDNRDRKGIARGLNQIISHSQSDILIILNADIRITDENFIRNLTFPILNYGLDLVSACPVEAPPTGFFGRILYASANIKQTTYEKLKEGNNVYTCHGQARSFSKNMYTNLHFPISIGEDAYSYFYCITKGYKFKFAKEAKLIYKLPENFSDHAKQSLRFTQSKNLMKKIFSKSNTDSEYSIPKNIMFMSFLTYGIKHPVDTALYSIVLLYTKLISIFVKNENKPEWEISLSSKKF